MASELKKALTATLHGGPHDGGKIHAVGERDIPKDIWLGPRWLNDGYGAWSSDGPSERFPCRYFRLKGRYLFQGWNK